MFFFRSSDWSRQFLDHWWNQTDFIQPFGQSKSGDNTALKHLISVMDKDELKRHVRVPEMQCLFNSNLWRPSWRSCHRLITVTKAVWQGRLFFEYSNTPFMSSERVKCAILTVCQMSVNLSGESVTLILYFWVLTLSTCVFGTDCRCLCKGRLYGSPSWLKWQIKVDEKCFTWNGFLERADRFQWDREYSNGHFKV